MESSEKRSSVVIGIDVGGSTTKIVGMRPRATGEDNTSALQMIAPLYVKATDPITSIYGAFGRFTLENGIALPDIDRVMMTGVGSSYMSSPIYSLDCRSVPEFSCVGLGGLYLSGLDEAIVVSMGTGTALVHAKKQAEGRVDIRYLGGTGIGGGTLHGLSKKMLGVDNMQHLQQLTEGGDLSKVDLRVKDISRKGKLKGVSDDLTAANFGKLSDLATPNDIARGITNMVAETVCMLAVFAARGCGVQDIVLTGNLIDMASIRNVFTSLQDTFGVRFLIPENARFGTVIGAALYQEN